MFYICIPKNIINLHDVWENGYIEVLIDNIVFNIPIKTFTFIIKSSYYIYKINSTLTSAIYYKIKTLTGYSYLITGNQIYITNNNYNTILINNNVYDNGVASIYHDKNDIIIKIGENVFEATL
jgi:hypothetical protein